MDNTSEKIAVQYLGKSLIIVLVGIFIYAIASVGYDFYISISKEKIEVSTTNTTNSN